METLCQSCEKETVTHEETPEEFYEPVRLCDGCRDRFGNHALRPKEWYNLCGIHGNLSEILGEEYYDETDGSALSPDEPVKDADQFPAPRLDEVADDPNALLTFSLIRSRIVRDPLMARRAVGQEYSAALKKLPQDVLLKTLSKNIEKTDNPDFFETILSICAELFGTSGADLVRNVWAEKRDDSILSRYPGAFRGLAYATSVCLPSTEAYDRLKSALAKMDESERSVNKGVLAWLEPPFTLEWIEEHADGPMDISWGTLASISGFDWPLAKRWLAKGPPLSLIALDALGLCLQRIFSPGSAFQYEIDNPPEAIDLEAMNLPDTDAFLTELDEHAARNATPRVQRSVDHIKGYATRLSHP